MENKIKVGDKVRCLVDHSDDGIVYLTNRREGVVKKIFNLERFSLITFDNPILFIKKGKHCTKYENWCIKEKMFIVQNKNLEFLGHAENEKLTFIEHAEKEEKFDLEEFQNMVIKYGKYLENKRKTEGKTNDF